MYIKLLQQKDKFFISTLSIALLGLAVLFFVLGRFGSVEAGSCGDLSSYVTPTLTTQVTDEGVELSWEPINDDRFSAYYIVISQNNSKPYYSADGYLTEITNPAVVSYLVDNSENYKGGDFLSPLQANQYYYFALSVKYQCGLVKTSQAVQQKFPDLNPPELITPSLSVLTKDDGSIQLSWSKVDHPYFQDYRVVISQLDSSPNYPDNGYLAVITSADSTKYVVDNSSPYSQGDFGEYLEKGKAYFFAVTASYLINDKEYYSTSNVFKLIYNGPTGNPTEYLPTPVITKISSDSKGVNLQWQKISDNRLEGFYIIIGGNMTPAYPQSGYLVLLDKGATSYLVNNSQPYKGGNFGSYLEHGQNYYFSVVAKYKNGYYRSAQAYAKKYQGPMPPLDSYLQLKAESTPGGIVLTWNKINDSRLYAYKVVISKSNSDPKYPADGWYDEVLNAKGEFDPGLTYFVVRGNKVNKDGDFTTLEEGEEYYLVLAGLLKDGGYIHSNVVKVKYQGDKGEVDVSQREDGANKAKVDPFVEEEKSLVKAIDTSLVNRLKGRILLQVEKAGQAWYVDPVSSKKYYLKDPDTAFAALRKFGLGITNADLAKIPVGIEERFVGKDSDGDGLPDKLEEGLETDPNKADSDGDGFSDGEEIKQGFNPLGSGKLTVDTSLVNRLKGRILLQVEKAGQAWYVNPADGKRYYLKDGQAAYDIMRFLSLGITNNDLRKIGVGNL